MNFRYKVIIPYAMIAATFVALILSAKLRYQSAHADEPVLRQAQQPYDEAVLRQAQQPQAEGALLRQAQQPNAEEAVLRQAQQPQAQEAVLRQAQQPQAQQAYDAEPATEPVEVVEAPRETLPEIRTDVLYPYYIEVNRAASTVTVYGIAKDDPAATYSVPYKSFICSCGNGTPLGTFTTGIKQRWGSLVGGVWGQYTTQITGHILFHSVPYFTMDASDLEYEEYNKLGTIASLGCVRMTVEDVKWIYDNCPTGTTVTIYDDADDPGPLGKPEAAKIDVNSTMRGWDPTDPDPDNPYNGRQSKVRIDEMEVD